MYNPEDNTWTTGSGENIPLSELKDWHLLNIQRMLREWYDDPSRLIQWIEDLADDYKFWTGDKDWVTKPAIPTEEEIRKELKVPIMKISEEVNRRGLVPLLPRTRPLPKIIIET